ncbi:hypothetical protein ACFS7Z_26565 [Pontibacter toksunensis]|uniref:Uncharacterized protein n=1 Tax=Pontibacter toksunensis TaxID=1332631 RepID=A0ABW6C8Q3_9BACT
MTLSQFLCKPLADRTRLVLVHGNMLAVRLNKPCCIFLYRMRGFFAEVWYSKADSGVVKVRGFNGTSSL